MMIIFIGEDEVLKQGDGNRENEYSTIAQIIEKLY